ncbi:MAG: GNAT family N-acetyltransferase [Lachnospiraceae bacterium]|nr:GNAT family N-acetyltransferase [Lachnospiraceae bacterium]
MLEGVLFDFTPSSEDAINLRFLCDDLHTWNIRFIQNQGGAGSTVDLYRDMVHCLALSPQNCLAITDSYEGVLSAKAAGIPCIGYEAPGTADNLSGAYAIIQSFRFVDPGYLSRTHAHALSYPAFIIRTERLVIRELSEEDFPVLYAMCTEPATAAFMDEVLSDYDTEQEKHLAYLRNIYPFYELALWGVYERETGKLVGRVGFSLPEDDSDCYWLGYLIDAPYRGRGYATECVRAALHFASCQECRWVSAKIRKNNPISVKVLEQCLFPYECTGETADAWIYRIDLA